MAIIGLSIFGILAFVGIEYLFVDTLKEYNAGVERIRVRQQKNDRAYEQYMQEIAEARRRYEENQ